MKTTELDGKALEYWCARALVDEREEVRFVSLEPVLVVTLTHGELRKLEQRFAPASAWADAADVLERARDLRLATRDDGYTRCSARFAGCDRASDGEGPNPRIALIRSFVRARFGEQVDDAYPSAPHAVRDGVVIPYEAGAPLPTYAEERGRAGDETGDIRSVPRP